MKHSEKNKPKEKIFFLNGCNTCEPNGFLINSIINFLKLNNYRFSKDIADCEVALINTCGVTNSRASESRVLLEKALKHENVKKIILFGCLVGIVDVSDFPEKVVCVGVKELDKFNDLFSHRIPIEKVPRNALDSDLFVSYQEKITAEDYFVLICQGCLNCCSYCNIKKAKGSPSSRKKEDIIEEIREGLKIGRKEFVLLADDCGSYGKDLGTNIIDLIKEIFSLDKSVRLKLSTLFPGQLMRLYDEFMDLIKTGRISYINLPFQSGSNRILGLMNRKYDIEKVKTAVRDIRSFSPETWLYTHVLINFPTETWKDFTNSVDAALLFDEALFITYSDNKLTEASKIKPKVDAKEQHKRIRHIRENLLKKGYIGVMAEKQDEPYVPEF